MWPRHVVVTPSMCFLRFLRFLPPPHYYGGESLDQRWTTSLPCASLRTDRRGEVLLWSVELNGLENRRPQGLTGSNPLPSVLLCGNDIRHLTGWRGLREWAPSERRRGPSALRRGLLELRDRLSELRRELFAVARRRTARRGALFTLHDARTARRRGLARRVRRPPEVRQAAFGYRRRRSERALPAIRASTSTLRTRRSRVGVATSSLRLLPHTCRAATPTLRAITCTVRALPERDRFSTPTLRAIAPRACASSWTFRVCACRVVTASSTIGA